MPSRVFAQFRSAGIRLAIRERQGYLVKPGEWNELDPSEKSMISSLLGLTVTKLLVERLLHAPIMLFLDVHFTFIGPNGGLDLRPDFVAFTRAGIPFSVEAKGRSQFQARTLRQAKAQARALGMVNRRHVRAAIACVSSFRHGVLRAHFADPIPEGEDYFEAQVDENELMPRYRQNILRFEENSTEGKTRLTLKNGNILQLRTLPDLDLEYGFLPGIGNLSDLSKVGSEDSLVSQVAEMGGELGPDGVIVLPGETWRSLD